MKYYRVTDRVGSVSYQQFLDEETPEFNPDSEVTEMSEKDFNEELRRFEEESHLDEVEYGPGGVIDV